MQLYHAYPDYVTVMNGIQATVSISVLHPSCVSIHEYQRKLQGLEIVYVYRAYVSVWLLKSSFKPRYTTVMKSVTICILSFV